MSAKIYECRWANCHLDFKEVDQYKEHIEAHIEANPAQPVSDIARYRRAAGFGPCKAMIISQRSIRFLIIISFISLPIRVQLPQHTRVTS